jgi:hypothetical protein
MTQVTFNRQSYEALKRAHAKAKADGADSFVFEGNGYLTKYAHYLIEYLSMELGEPKPPAGYTAEELERDNPYNQWMYDK